VINHIAPHNLRLVSTLLIKIILQIQISYKVLAVLAHDTNKKMANIGQAHGMTQSTLGDRSTSMCNKDVREII
jgi:hypothetical protein